MGERREADEVYWFARARARRTPTALLRRRERRAVARAKAYRPNASDLAELAAARVELSLRAAAGNRWGVIWGDGHGRRAGS
jgi:hypothetical protein